MDCKGMYRDLSCMLLYDRRVNFLTKNINTEKKCLF